MEEFASLWTRDKRVNAKQVELCTQAGAAFEKWLSNLRCEANKRNLNLLSQVMLTDPVSSLNARSNTEAKEKSNIAKTLGEVVMQ